MLSFCLVVGIAFAVYWIFNAPLWSALLPYLIVVWPSVQSAIWLRRLDPIPERGRACFWFYLAAGGWKAASAAFLTVLFIMLVDEVTGRRADMDQFAHTMWALIIGTGLTILFGVVGSTVAMKHQWRIFVIPNLYFMSGGDFSRIDTTITPYQGLNHAIYVVAISLYTPFMLIAVSTFFVAILLDPESVLASVLIAMDFVLMFGGAAVLLPVYGAYSDLVVALSTLDCWSEFDTRAIADEGLVIQTVELCNDQHRAVEVWFEPSGERVVLPGRETLLILNALPRPSASLEVRLRDDGNLTVGRAGDTNVVAMIRDHVVWKSTS